MIPAAAITERKTASIKLEEAKAEIEAKAKELAISNRKLKETMAELARSNADLEQFAYVASHDLQEPLRTMSSYVLLLEKRYEHKLDDKAREFIALAADGALRMQAMISDLLTYSRVETQARPFAETSSDEALSRALSDLKATIEESGAVVTHDPLPVITADSAQMAQLLQNLVGNGIKFRRPDGPPRIHVSAVRSASKWVFSVKENGIGIDPKYFDRVFVIFQRLHSRRQYPGTGMGLAICKRIIERHGSRIWVESESGKGSTFYFTVPLGRY